jgi:hypothetical protein
MSQKIPLRLNNYFVASGTEDTWSIDIKPCIRKPMTYHDELLYNASIIKDSTSDKIYLMYSGGIDSEYILEIFLSLGINIIPVIVKLTPNYNEYDFNMAVTYCKNKNVEPIVIDINFDNFVNTGRFREIADSVECPVYQYPALFDAMSKLDGLVLMGSDEPHFARKVDNLWIYDEMERIYTVSRWYELTGINGTPAFLNWSSETLLAFQNEKLVLDLFRNRWPGRMGTNFLKERIYNNAFDITKREKQDGYEVIRQSDIFRHEDIQAVISDPMDATFKRNGYWSIDQKDLRNLLESKI